MEGWMDGWMEVKAGLRIAYSNQKEKRINFHQKNTKKQVKTLLKKYNLLRFSDGKRAKITQFHTRAAAQSRPAFVRNSQMLKHTPFWGDFC